MSDNNSIMLMIASSSSDSSFEGKKKSVLPARNFKCSPLAGIKYDLKHFKSRFGSGHSIETSQDQDMLLSRSYVIKWLSKYFKQTKNDCYLFYTGHGHKNGDWALQTQERPSADRITLEEIVNLWNSNKIYLASKLFIFMDSCYSGKWAYGQDSLNGSDIGIFTSSMSNEVSSDWNGGLFFNCLLGPTNLFSQNYERLKKYQTPTYLASNTKVYQLSQSKLRGLNQDISNAKSIYKQENPPQRARSSSVAQSNQNRNNNQGSYRSSSVSNRNNNTNYNNYNNNYMHPDELLQRNAIYNQQMYQAQQAQQQAQFLQQAAQYAQQVQAAQMQQAAQYAQQLQYAQQAAQYQQQQQQMQMQYQQFQQQQQQQYMFPQMGNFGIMPGRAVMNISQYGYWG